jgi:hypothetical protein
VVCHSTAARSVNAWSSQGVSPASRAMTSNACGECRAVCHVASCRHLLYAVWLAHWPNHRISVYVTQAVPQHVQHQTRVKSVEAATQPQGPATPSVMLPMVHPAQEAPARTVSASQVGTQHLFHMFVGNNRFYGIINMKHAIMISGQVPRHVLSRCASP